MTLADYLLQYNEAINIHAGFSLHRLISFVPEEVPFVHYQQSSGMLGVHGNIGFSTSLHGLLAAYDSGEDSAVCVGDDACAVTRNPEGTLHFMERFGKLALEKCDVLESTSNEPQYTRFLKRCFRLSEGFMSIDAILKLPTMLLACKSEDRPDRVELFKSETDAIHKVISQVSTLLWALHRFHFDASDEDLDFYMSLCRQMYQEWDIPSSGLFSGTFLRRPAPSEPIRIMLHAPNLQAGVDYRVVDWVEVLWYRRPQNFFLSYQTVESPIQPQSMIGEQITTSSKALDMLVDFGKATRTPLTEVVDIDMDPRAKDKFLKDMTKTRKRLYLYDVLELPDSFVPCFDTVPIEDGLEHVMYEYI